jgi:hypothetical protein
MRLHVILGKHDGCDKVYCWYISERKAAHVRRGDLLYVETSKGDAVVTAVTDPLTGDRAIEALSNCGARFPLKRVISFANRVMQETIVQRFREDVQTEIYKLNENIRNMEVKQ